MFIVVTLACIGLGFWSAYLQPFRNQARAIAALKDFEAYFTSRPADGPVWQRWLVTKLLGENAFVKVEGIALSDPRVDDVVAKSFAGLPHLKRMSLEQTRVGDEGLKSIASLKKLETLSLAYTQVSDEGVAAISQLPRLVDLKLTGTHVSDESVESLLQLPAIRVLYVRWTKISDAGAAELREGLPVCEVYHQARRSP